MIPGVNFRYAALIVNHHHLVSLKTSSINAASRDTFAHTARRDVQNFTQAVLLNGDADFSQQPGPVRDILHRRRFAITEETGKRDQKQSGDDKAAYARGYEGKQGSLKADDIVEQVAEKAKAQQEEHNRRGVQEAKPGLMVSTRVCFTRRMGRIMTWLNPADQRFYICFGPIQHLTKKRNIAAWGFHAGKTF